MKFIVLVIFILAIVIRFLYFPNNIYFGFDQARDAYQALDITSGDLKIIGPTTTFEGLNHGVLYYYILAPLYLLGSGNPEFPAAVLRIFNALGVFLIFSLSSILFGKRAGLIAALLFAISFEQTQFAIYMGNPTLGSLSVMLMYLGLAMVVFAQKEIGLMLAFLGLGFSIQFQFALTYLIIPLAFIILIFYRNFLKLSVKTWLVSFSVLIVTLSSFIVAEIKYSFRSTQALFDLINSQTDKDITAMMSTYLFTVYEMGKFNLVGDLPWNRFVMIGLLAIFVYLLFKKDDLSKRIIFLGIWFFGIFTTLVISGGTSNPWVNKLLYYPNVGVSISLLIFVGLLIEKIFVKNRSVAIFLLILIIIFNLQLITTLNHKGTIEEIDVQQGMLLSDQKRVLDFIYQDSKREPFAVKAVTMPMYINTTWSYLFQWYGKSKYGYLPIWNGKNALGFPGNLTVQEAQENLPSKRYVIIEPLRGVRMPLVDDFLKEEGYFTKIVSEKRIGLFVVQKREKY